MKDDLNYGELLKLITNTRLLFNTIEEEGNCNGIGSFAANRYSKCTVEQQQYILDRYCKMVEEQSEGNLDLLDILEDFQEYKEYYDLYIKRNTFFKNNKEKSLTMILDLFCHPERAHDVKPAVEKILQDIKRQGLGAIYFIFLFHLGVLIPSTKQNDVKDIEKDFHHLLDFFEAYYEPTLFQAHPRIDYYRNLIKDGETYLNRILLFRATDDILSGIVSWSDHSELLDKQHDFKEKFVTPDIEWDEEEGITRIWMEERNGSIIEGTFYVFTLLQNESFWLDEYKYDNQKSQLLTTRYTTRFIKAGGKIIMYVIHPRNFIQVVENGNNNDLEEMLWAKCLMDNKKEPTEIGLKTYQGNPSCFPLQKLKLLKDKKRASLYSDMLNTYTKVNRFPETDYDFQLTLYAITRENLFIIDLEEECFYCVPLDRPELEDLAPNIRMTDNIGLLKMNGKKYVVFDDISLYLNVTTPEDRERNGIEAVDEIF